MQNPDVRVAMIVRFLLLFTIPFLVIVLYGLSVKLIEYIKKHKENDKDLD